MKGFNNLDNNCSVIFNDFEDDRISCLEMFDTLGGIEQNEIYEDIIVDDLTFKDTVYDKIVPDFQVEKEDDHLKKDTNRN